MGEKRINQIRELLDFEIEGLDALLLNIELGKIKCGRYANLVKIKKGSKMRKELFKDDNWN